MDDGSTDDTGRVLEELRAEAPERIDLLPIHENRGKAEAVRCGMLRALDSAPDYAGYWDADLATPLGEVPGFVARLRADATLELVMGARVKLLGRTIVRNPARHYLGRVFATCVSVMLRLAVYDTQCGAKLFRADRALLEPLFGEPFRSTWIFDVEILARLIRRLREQGGPAVEDVVYEYPLTTWRDVEGSKVRGADFLRAAFELANIWRVYRPGAARAAGGGFSPPRERRGGSEAR